MKSGCSSVCPAHLTRPALLLGLALLLPAAHAFDGDAAAGKANATVCAACHGADGNSSNPTWPKLAGQHPQYLYAQLQGFHSGKRSNPIMSPQAASLSDEKMRDLAAWFASQTMKPGSSGDPALVDAGEALFRQGKPAQGVPSCASCHGDQAMGSAEEAYPRLASQHGAYLQAQLKAFRAGERKDSANAQIMAGIARGLGDDDIAALAAYLSSMPR